MFFRRGIYWAAEGGGAGGTGGASTGGASTGGASTGGDGQGDPGGNAPAGGPAPVSQAPSPGGSQTTTPTGGESPGEGSGQPQAISLSSEQLAQRLERARGAERTALLQQLGFESVEALQAAIQTGQEAIQAQMSEEERRQAALAEAQQRAQQAQEQARQAMEQARQAELRAEAMSAMAGRFADPQLAFRLLDLSGVNRSDDGTWTGLQEAIEQLATTAPWSLTQPAGTPDGKKKIQPPKIGATNGEGDGEQRTSDDQRRQRYFGGAGGSDFFQGSGVRPAVEKK